MAGLGWIFWAKLGCALLTGIGATGNMILTSKDIENKAKERMNDKEQNTEPNQK